MTLKLENVVGRSSRSEELKPIKLWERTGNVTPGTSGAGCAVECIYCNQIAMDTVDGERQAPYLSGMVDGGLSINTRMYVGNKLDKTIKLDVLKGAINEWPLYTPHSPVILENFNDPGNDWRSTAELAKMLVADFGHKAAISFITKMGIKNQDIAALKEAQQLGAKLVGIVTYTNMPQAIEPSSSRVRLTTIKRLKEAGIPVIVSMRPMIKGINDSQENIDLVLQQVAPYADFIIVGGLFVFEQFTLDAFKKAGYPLDESYGEQIYSPAKVMKMGYKEIVRERATTLQLPILVHNHTSCAIAHVMTSRYDTETPDRFVHWSSPTGLQFENDCSHCPSEQKSVCKKDAEQTAEQAIDRAQKVLKRLGYSNISVCESLDVPNTLLVVDAVLTFEEIASIKEGCGWYVDNLPNAIGMFTRLKEALQEDMGLDHQKVVTGMFLVGQEWHIVIRSHGLNDSQIHLIEKWIRSRSRHRAKVLKLEDVQNGDLPEMITTAIQTSHNIQKPDVIAAEITRMKLLL